MYSELNLPDLNQAFETLHSKITNCINEISPEKVITVSTNRTHCEPRMSKGLQKCSKKQLDLYKWSLITKSIKDCEKYKQYRTTLKKVKRTAKKEFYYNKCIEFKSNTKKLWQMINNITGKKANKISIIDSIKVDNIELNDRKSVSNYMCSFFSSVGCMFASNIAQSKHTINEYNTKIIRNKNSIFVSPTSHIEVSNLIDSLQNKKSSGWDGISNVLLKSMKTVLCKPLSILFNRSIEEGKFPNIFKSADVIPLFKSGVTNLCNNYRPISLLLTISKVLEKVIYKRVYQFLTNTKQFYQS